MVITDGNVTYAILKAFTGPWLEINKKSTYHFGVKKDNPEQALVSIDSARPINCQVLCIEGTCYVEIENVKYKVWYHETPQEVKLELHSTRTKLRLERL